MSKITRHLATAATTLTVAGGILFTAGAASAASNGTELQSGTTAVARDHGTRNGDSGHRWDGHRWWNRHNGHGHWYSTDHGDRYRFDGHRFYQWKGGKWRLVTADYAHRHDFDRWHFSGNKHHDSGRSGHGR
ncbi:hypothetical protein [Actinomadura alba]|uniref:BcpO-related WXXGXW repeat protein n=1 Tax=Actinomadura alba TaxID=406431 RepID=A0ABR7M1A1_9ACTN|nr:hypothetical protein [Actinomadura alba]MBC6470903.1 hypothetical protein [Actinomadura alba]